MKKFLYWIFFAGALLLFLERELVAYLWMQGKGQFKVLWYAEDIHVILEDDKIEKELKEKILLVQEIKTFAEDDLNLNVGSKYSTIYDQKGEQILWNLSASSPFELKSVQWRFPIVGNISYKGFFDLPKAKSEEAELRSKGFDTRIRAVSAWSTLGWFNDPILSNTLDRSEGSIAELFIHEITHSNIFIKDSLTFNENLASFIGEQGARLYLMKKYGILSSQLSDYLSHKMDRSIFIEHSLCGVAMLNELYGGFDEVQSFETKESIKKNFMKAWVHQLDTLPFANRKKFVHGFKEGLPNNAFFLAFERYSSQKNMFLKELDNSFNGDLTLFIDYYKSENQ